MSSSAVLGFDYVDPYQVEKPVTINAALEALDAAAGDLADSSIQVIFDGGGSAISSGQKIYVEVPFPCTITGWTALADQSGSIVVDVWKDTYANYPPLVGDTIAGSEKPTISSSTKGQDLTLSTWTTAVSAGDILCFNVDSCTTITRATIALRLTKTL